MARRVRPAAHPSDHSADLAAPVPGIEVDGPDLSLADRIEAMRRKNIGR